MKTETRISTDILIPIGMTKFKLDRKKFIEYYPIELAKLIERDIVTDDIIKGNEFVVTAEDLLQAVGYIEGRLMGHTAPVHFSDIELFYTQPDEVEA
jgi:hypothetical protein